VRGGCKPAPSQGHREVLGVHLNINFCIVYKIFNNKLTVNLASYYMFMQVDHLKQLPLQNFVSFLYLYFTSECLSTYSLLSK